MLATRQCPSWIITTVGLVALIVVVLNVGGTAPAAEGDKAPQKGKRAQTGKKDSPKGEGSKKGAKTPAAKPLDCTGEFPKIHKVQPDEGKAGTKVTITGKNFGQPGCLSMVAFGAGSPSKFTHKDDSTITTTVPAAKKGLRLLTVNTAAGQDSKPFLVR